MRIGRLGLVLSPIFLFVIRTKDPAIVRFNYQVLHKCTSCCSKKNKYLIDSTVQSDESFL